MKNQLRAQIAATLINYYRHDARRGLVACKADALPAPLPGSVTREQMKAAKTLIEDIEGPVHFLPWNLADFYWAKHRANMPTRNYEPYGRALYVAFPGFLEGLLEQPLTEKLLARTQNYGGVNSPYTTGNLHLLQLRWKSPGRVLRKLKALLWRTNEILRPTGWRASWRSIMFALCYAPRATGKAAVVAAAHLLSGGCSCRSYRTARAFLARNLNQCGRIDRIDDAIRIVCDPRPVAVIHGIRIFYASSRREDIPTRRALLFFERGTDTYHGYDPSFETAETEERFLREETYHVYDPGYATKEHLLKFLKTKTRAVIRDWKAQRALRERETFLEGVSILVYREDARHAGHCEFGINDWMSRHPDVAGRVFIPAEELLKIDNSSRIRAVVEASKAKLLSSL